LCSFASSTASEIFLQPRFAVASSSTAHAVVQGDAVLLSADMARVR